MAELRQLRRAQDEAEAMGLAVEVVALPSRIPAEAATVLELWEAGELVARCDDVGEVLDVLRRRQSGSLNGS